MNKLATSANLAFFFGVTEVKLRTLRKRMTLNEDYFAFGEGRQRRYMYRLEAVEKALKHPSGANQQSVSYQQETI